MTPHYARGDAHPPSESGRRQYRSHDALGGELHPAGPAVHRAEVVTRATLAYEVPRAIPVNESTSYSPRLQRFSMDERQTVTPGPKRAPRATRAVKRAVVVTRPPQIATPAADWSRWPAGTVFRLLSTGQNYRVEDYGWALSGPNTLHLYIANHPQLNSRY